MQPLTTITTYRDGQKVVSLFWTVSEMLDYAHEEVKWENTIRVQCKQYDLDLRGDFASYHPTKEQTK